VDVGMDMSEESGMETDLNDRPTILILDQRINMRIVFLAILSLMVPVLLISIDSTFISNPVGIYHDAPEIAICFYSLLFLGIMILMKTLYRRTVIVDTSAIRYKRSFRSPVWIAMEDLTHIRMSYQRALNPFEERIVKQTLIVEFSSTVQGRSGPRTIVLKGNIKDIEFTTLRCFMKKFFQFIQYDWPDIPITHDRGIMQDLRNAYYCDRVRSVTVE